MEASQVILETSQAITNSDSFIDTFFDFFVTEPMSFFSSLVECLLDNIFVVIVFCILLFLIFFLAFCRLIKSDDSK